MDIVRLPRWYAWAWRQARAAAQAPPLLDAVVEYPAWRLTLRARPFELALPWMTLGAVRFLRRTVRRGVRVFEYGAGGSTLFCAARGADVVSVEHDPGWATRVRDALHEQGSHAQVLVRPHNGVADAADAADWRSCVSSEGARYDDYVNAIDTVDDDSVDLVIVDGRARPACFVRALRKVKPGGVVLLDDAWRDHYQPAQAEAARRGFTALRFPGAVCSTEQFGETRGWRRPRSLGS